MSHCGKVSTKPANKVMGTPHGCLKKGIGIGLGLGEEKGLKRGKKIGKKKGKNPNPVDFVFILLCAAKIPWANS